MVWHPSKIHGNMDYLCRIRKLVQIPHIYYPCLITKFHWSLNWVRSSAHRLRFRCKGCAEKFNYIDLMTSSRYRVTPNFKHKSLDFGKLREYTTGCQNGVFTSSFCLAYSECGWINGQRQTLFRVRKAILRYSYEFLWYQFHLGNSIWKALINPLVSWQDILIVK